MPPPAPAPWALSGLSPWHWSLGQVTEQHNPPWWPFTEGVRCCAGRSVQPLLLSAHNKCFGFALCFQSSEEIQGATISLEIYHWKAISAFPLMPLLAPCPPQCHQAAMRCVLSPCPAVSLQQLQCWLFFFLCEQSPPRLACCNIPVYDNNQQSAEPSTPALMKRSAVATCNIHYAPSLLPRCHCSTGWCWHGCHRLPARGSAENHAETFPSLQGLLELQHGSRSWRTGLAGRNLSNPN